MAKVVSSYNKVIGENTKDVTAEAKAQRQNAVATDVGRDNSWLTRLAAARELAKKTKPSTPRKAKTGEDRLRLSTKGLDTELRRLHPSRLRLVSDSLAARATAAGLSLEHIGITIGTVIHGIDLSGGGEGGIAQETVDTIRQCLLERKVVFFRDQQLTRQQHVALGR